jgi:hypothetical protein
MTRDVCKEKNYVEGFNHVLFIEERLSLSYISKRDAGEAGLAMA